MSTLWGRKPMSQPPGFGAVTTVKATPTSAPMEERLALRVLVESRGDRRNRASATSFDRGTKGRK